MPYPHVPIQVQLDRIKADNTGAPKNITILGAGMAGLAAAYVLRENGHNVTIYEGSDRIGGRVFTHRFSNGQYGELGAMRIPASNDYTLYFANLLNLTLRPFISYFVNDQCFLDMRGQVARIKDQLTAINPHYSLSDWEKTQFPGTDLLIIPLKKLLGTLTPQDILALFTGENFSANLELIEKLTVGQFVNQTSVGADAQEFTGSITALTGIFDTALTMLIRDGITNTSLGLQEIVGGMDLLPQGLAATMMDIIHLNTEVLSIRNHGNHADVTMVNVLPNGAVNTIQVTADYVLCTIPFPVLRRLDLQGFNPLKIYAINYMNYASATKVLLNCSERFWETKYGIFGGASNSDRISRYTYYPSDHADVAPVTIPRTASVNEFTGEFAIENFGIAGLSHTPRPITTALSRSQIGGPGVLLASYVVGNDAIRLGTVDQQTRARIVMKSVSNFHPEILEPGMVTDHASMAWDNYKWAGGAFAHLWTQQMPDIYQAAIAPDGCVFFAGEHCSPNQGWIQGALIASLRAVDEIVKAPSP